MFLIRNVQDSLNLRFKNIFKKGENMSYPRLPKEKKVRIPSKSIFLSLLHNMNFNCFKAGGSPIVNMNTNTDVVSQVLFRIFDITNNITKFENS